MSENIDILAIVGSRNYTNYDYFKSVVIETTKNLRIKSIISGGATGVDNLAEKYSLEYKIPITIYKPEWEIYGKKAGPIRNTKIVDDATHLLAFPAKDSVGTLDTINKATKKNIPIITINI